MVATSPDERSPAAQPAATTTAMLRAERAAISKRGAEGRSRKTALSENCPDAGSGEEGGEVSTSQPYAARSGSQSATCFSDLELEPEAAIFPSNREIHVGSAFSSERLSQLQDLATARKDPEFAEFVTRSLSRQRWSEESPVALRPTIYSNGERTRSR